MRKCLLIVDVQMGFMRDWMGGLARRIEAIQEQFQFVYCTKFVNPQGSFYRTLLEWGEMSPQSNDIKLAFEPSSRAVVFEKQIYSCVSASFLDELKKNGINEVFICGVDTDICVTKCAVDLFENGVRPIVLENFCASSGGKQCHEYGIKTIRRYIGGRQIDSRK